MTPVPPALVAVIGPVEPALLAAWTAHYRTLGVEGFHVAFHFPEHVPDTWRHELVAASHELGVNPTHVGSGPWHEHTNTELREILREQAGPGWHLLADSDEFQQYPAPLDEVTAAAEQAGQRVVGGLMLDRVTAGGRLTHWRAEAGLDRAFPLGGHLTHRLLKGDPRKIVLVRSGVAVASGNHRAPRHKPDPDTLACVHHFKWRSGVLDDLRRRVERFTSATGSSTPRPYGTKRPACWSTSTGTTGALTSPAPASASATSPSTACPMAGARKPARLQSTGVHPAAAKGRR